MSTARRSRRPPPAASRCRRRSRRPRRTGRRSSRASRQTARTEGERKRRMSAVKTEGAWDELSLGPEEYRRASARYRRRRSSKGYLFILPYFVPFLAFLVVPAFWSVWLSFNQGGLLDSARFVGFRNWREIGADTELTTSIENTGKYAVTAIVLVFTLALFLALILNRYRKGSNLYKLALYVPLLAPAVLVGLIWQFIANYDFGLFNLI